MILTKLLRGDRIQLSALASSDVPTLARWYERAGLIEEARYIMLGRSTPEEEILGVLRSYEADRAGR